MSGRDIVAYEAAYQTTTFEPVQARMRKRRLLEVLATHRPRSVLEIGCGTDALFNHHAAFERYCVVEPGERFAALAREQAAGDSRIRVVEAFMEDAVAALAADRYDLVLLSGLLHEVVQCAPLLEAVRRVCTPATLVHVNVPNARSLHRLLALEMGLIADVRDLSAQQRSLQQHHTFDIDSLRALCVQCGFAVEEEGSYFVKPFTHAQMARLQETGVLTEAMLDGLYGLERHVSGLGSEIYVHLRAAGEGRT